MKSVYRPSQSALDATLQQINCCNSQKAVFLEQSLKKAQRQLNEIRFQQNHMKSQTIELNEHHQLSLKKVVKRTEQLQDQINISSQYVSIQQLKTALQTNNWTPMTAYFLNPLALLQHHQVQEPVKLHQQVLLKHSEQKLIILQRTIDSENRIAELNNQIKMIQEDMRGKIDQNTNLIIEYEELEELLEQWRKETNSNTEPLGKICSIKRQLNELKMTYFTIQNEKGQKNQEFNEIAEQIDRLQQTLQKLRKEDNNADFDWERKISQSILFWLSPDKVYQIIQQEEMNKGKLQNLVLLIHDMIVTCCKCLLNKSMPFEERQRKFDQNYSQLEKLAKDSQWNWFKQLKGEEFECLLTQRNYQELLNYIEQKSIIFHRAMNKKNNKYQIENILDRISEIESVNKKNHQLISITYPQQIGQIRKHLEEIQEQLKSQVNDLVYHTQLEQDYFQQIIRLNEIEIELPKLMLDQGTGEDCNFLQLELQQNKKEQQELEEHHQERLSSIQRKLKQLEDEECNQFYQILFLDEIISKIEVIQNAIQDCKKRDNSLIYMKKENIPPSRRTSLGTQEQSILGTVHIDMSQERTTQKQNNRKSFHFQNELTDRSLSKSRSKSQLNNNSITRINDKSQNLIDHHYLSPTQQVRKTKLTLVQPQQSSVRTNLSSQMSQKNPLLSPNSIFGGHSSQRFLDVDQSMSIHPSARRIQDGSFRMSGKNLQLQFKQEARDKTPQQQQEQKIFKVYIRTTATKMMRKMSVGCQVNNYSSKYMKFNQRMKQLEFYNSNKMLHELGQKDMTVTIKQISNLSSIYEVKGVLKANFTFSGISMLISRNQKLDILFGKLTEAEECYKLLK